MAETQNHGYYGNWSEVTPRYNDAPVSFPALGALISIGSILKLTDGRIVRLLSSTLEMTSSDTGTDTESHILYGNVFIEINHPLPIPKINAFIRAIRTKEVVETKKKAAFYVSSIADLVFVMSKDEVEEQGLCLHGIHNAYFTHFRMEDDGNEVIIPDDVVYFASDSSDGSLSCFSKRVWDGLLTLQSYFRKILSRGAKAQGDHTTYKLKFSFSREVWDYLRFRLAKVVDNARYPRSVWIGMHYAFGKK